MITLICSILVFILLSQYIIIVAMLILNDQIPFIQSRLELLLFLIPIIPIIVFTVAGIYEIIFDIDTRKYLKQAIKKLK